MKTNILMLLLGVMFIFGGSLDTVSDPLVNTVNVDQVGYVEFIGDNDVTAINFEKIAIDFEVNNTFEIASITLVRPSMLNAGDSKSFVRNKSSGKPKVHEGINNDNKSSLSDDLIFKRNLNSKGLRIKQEQNQANTNELVYPLLC